MNDDATNLLLQTMMQTRAASELIDSLVEATREHQVLKADEVKPCIDAVDRHLRHASSAATALANVARGLKLPKIG